MCGPSEHRLSSGTRRTWLTGGDPDPRVPHSRAPGPAATRTSCPDRSCSHAPVGSSCWRKSARARRPQRRQINLLNQLEASPTRRVREEPTSRRGSREAAEGRAAALGLESPPWGTRVGQRGGYSAWGRQSRAHEQGVCPGQEPGGAGSAAGCGHFSSELGREGPVAPTQLVWKTPASHQRPRGRGQGARPAVSHGEMRGPGSRGSGRGVRFPLSQL